MKNPWMEVTEKEEKTLEGIDVIVEAQKGAHNLYREDPGKKALVLDSVLSESIEHGDLGVVPETLYENGEPLTVLVLSEEPFLPGSVVNTRLIGALKLTHGGKYHLKLIGVPACDKQFSEMKEAEDLPKQTRDEIQHYFEHYKDLEGSTFKTVGWEKAEKAVSSVNHSKENYKKKGGA